MSKSAYRENEQFEKWFKAQFGKLPRECRPYRDVERDLKQAQYNLNQLQKEWDDNCDILIKFETAKYVKEASKKKFKF